MNYHDTRPPAFLLSILIVLLLPLSVNAQQPSALTHPNKTVVTKRVTVVEAGATTAHGLLVVDRHTTLVSKSFIQDGYPLIYKIVPSVEENKAPPTSEEFIRIPLMQPCGLALSPNQKTLYLCDTTAGRIFLHDPKTGQLRNAITTAGMPWNVRIEKDGEIWYLTTDGRLHQYIRSTQQTSVVMNKETKQPVEIPNAFDFVIHPQTQELIVTQQQPARVVAVDRTTGRVRTIAEAGLTNPEGIDVVVLDEDQVVFVVADTGSNKVFALRDRSRPIEPVVMLDGNPLEDGSPAAYPFTLPICVRTRPDDSTAVTVTARRPDGKTPLLMTLVLAIEVE